MPAYRLAPLAEEDLESIWLYSAHRWSVEQADRYYRDIIAAIDRLAVGEISGRPSEIRVGYLKHPVGRHFVFFRQFEGEIEVIRILHQSMDVNRHL